MWSSFVMLPLQLLKMWHSLWPTHQKRHRKGSVQKTQSWKNSVKAASSLMVVLYFTSSHPKTESKLNDIKNELDNWSWLYEHYWSCMILMSNDHSWSLIMLIMYEICWSCYDTLLIMHDICWSCYERLLIMHEICWSCYDRLLIMHDICWS